MKKCLALLTVILAVAGAGGQSIPASQSRVAGRFVAYNYGLWNTYPASISPATGSQTFTVINSYVNLGDGRLISPYSTNAPLRIGTETVTPSAVANCLVNDVRLGVCQITVTFALSHTNSDKISSATFGLQEALNDAGASGGGPVTVDSAWAGVGGTTAMISGATIPANTSIEDVRNGTSGGSGTVTGQASGVVPLGTAATTIGSQSHLDDGVTTPATITSTEPFAGTAGTFSGTMKANAAISAISPRNDIRWFGAVIDGATPIDTGLTSAINVCNAANGNACQPFLPCGGPNGCLIDNGSTVLPATPSSKSVELNIQGTVHLNSTLNLQSYYTLKCLGGSGVGQFQSAGAVCNIIGPSARGTMGTATTVVGTPTTFTPTYVAGSIANFHVGTAISIAGLQTCIVSATRTLNAALSPNTVLTVTGGCTNSSGTSETIRITAKQTITLTGCSDSSFNINQPIVNAQDWPNNTISIYEAGASGTATGCTLIGPDDYSKDIVRIEGVSGNVLTATLAKPHAATDVWGMVAIAASQPGPLINHIDFEGLAVSGAYGAQIWLDNSAVINFQGVYASPQSYIASSGVELDGAWWGQMNSVEFNGGNQVFSCNASHFNCGTSAYVYGLRCSQDSTRRNGIGAGNYMIRDATITGGIEIDGNGMDNSGGAGVDMALSNFIPEQTAEASIMIDNSHSMGGNTTVYVDFLTPSDNGTGSIQHFLGATDCCLTNAYATVPTQSSLGINATYQMTNPYWMNGVYMGGMAGANFITNPGSVYPHAATGILHDSTSMLVNLPGSGADLHPSLITKATLPTNNPVCGTCTTITGKDGVANSGYEIAATGVNFLVNVGTQTLTTYAGDLFVYGVWMKPGTNQNGSMGSGFGPVEYILATTGADRFIGGLGKFISGSVVPGVAPWGGPLFNMVNSSWALGMQVATVTTGDSTPHTIRFQLTPGSNPNGGMDYWDWWWMQVPGPNNPAWDGVTTRQDVMDWVQNELHSYVPSSAPGGSAIESMCPNCKLWWNSTADLYRNPTGGLKSDGNIDATGFTVGGSPITISPATTSTLGGVIPDGTSITVDGAGHIAAPSGTFVTTVPPWLQWQGDGSEAAPTCTSGCTVSGEHWYASVNVPIGQTMINNTQNSLILRSTGTCTIAGTISVSANTGGANGITATSNYGGSGGGGGFGAANGTAGSTSSPAGGGAAGTTGVSGGNGSAPSAQTQHVLLSPSPNIAGTNQAGSTSLVTYGGGAGGAGGSSGGAAGKGGGLVIIDCQTVNFTGTIDASGTNGGAGGANTGGGGGGGGGIVILRSPNMTNSGTITTTNGTGGAIGTGTSTKGGDGGTGWSKVFSN